MRGIKTSLAALCLLLGCSGSSEPSARSTTPTEAAVPTPAIVAPVVAPKAPPPACHPSDDYGWGGGLITASEVRYCLGRETGHRTCWRFDAATGAVSPLDVDTALTGDGVVVPAAWASPVAPATPWSAQTTEHGLQVCGPSGCAPFALEAPDTRIASATIDPTGTRVAVVRGAQAKGSALAVEIYDRASGARTGVFKAGSCARLYGFAGDDAVVGQWCANPGDGGRVLVGPDGKLVARLTGDYGDEGFGPLGGTRWAFHEQIHRRIYVYDTATGARVDSVPVPSHDGFSDYVAFARDAVYTYTSDGAITLVSPQLKTVASGVAPRCVPTTASAR